MKLEVLVDSCHKYEPLATFTTIMHFPNIRILFLSTFLKMKITRNSDESKRNTKKKVCCTITMKDKANNFDIKGDANINLLIF